jgi:predicted nuclease of predicted toxin-antitoxin system
VRILFDHCVPAPLRRVLRHHEVTLASEAGWQRLQNGRLIAAADEAGYDVLVSTDQNIRYQQSLTDRRIALLVLTTQNWPKLKPHAAKVATALDGIVPGSYVELDFGV